MKTILFKKKKNYYDKQNSPSHNLLSIYTYFLKKLFTNWLYGSQIVICWINDSGNCMCHTTHMTFYCHFLSLSVSLFIFQLDKWHYTHASVLGRAPTIQLSYPYFIFVFPNFAFLLGSEWITLFCLVFSKWKKENEHLIWFHVRLSTS